MKDIRRTREEIMHLPTPSSSHGRGWWRCVLDAGAAVPEDAGGDGEGGKLHNIAGAQEDVLRSEIPARALPNGPRIRPRKGAALIAALTPPPSDAPHPSA